MYQHKPKLRHNRATLKYSALDSDLAKVSPGDSDSVGGTGEMQPGSNVYRTTGTAGLHTGLIRRVIAL